MRDAGLWWGRYCGVAAGQPGGAAPGAAPTCCSCPTGYRKRSVPYLWMGEPRVHMPSLPLLSGRCKIWDCDQTQDSTCMRFERFSNPVPGDGVCIAPPVDVCFACPLSDKPIQCSRLALTSAALRLLIGRLVLATTPARPGQVPTARRTGHPLPHGQVSIPPLMERSIFCHVPELASACR